MEGVEQETSMGWAWVEAEAEGTRVEMWAEATSQKPPVERPGHKPKVESRAEGAKGEPPHSRPLGLQDNMKVETQVEPWDWKDRATMKVLEGMVEPQQ